MEKLYNWNRNFRKIRQGDAYEGDEFSNWGGYGERLMLTSIYSLAFLCFLRFDEVLKIQAKDIEIVDETIGSIKLTLPFRKTHQTGNCKPFVLYISRESPALDAVIHLLRWMDYCKIKDGFIFRRIDRVRGVATGNHALVSTPFFIRRFLLHFKIY